jgi:outer membrane protein assembly factor BamB
MKVFIQTLILLAITLHISCEKEFSGRSMTTYDFFERNGVAKQSYVINGSLGGSFTTPQGTKVTIPANAFKTQSGQAVTGNVTIEFKDIYRKSDMLLSNKPTITLGGKPLKSGGEFFIKGLWDNSALVLNSGKQIAIEQPASLTGGLDTFNIMQPFTLQDTFGMGGWVLSITDSIRYAASSYIYNLYKFNAPEENGSWLNCDNQSFFNGFPITSLTLRQIDDPGTASDTQVFLIFKNITTTVKVSMANIGTFPYSYAPQGLECTLVAFEVKNDKLYSSFVPIKITTNLKVNFSLSETTTDKFISSLRALD